MNGLLSAHPSPGAIRLILGGFLLQMVSASFVVRTETVQAPLRVITWVVLVVALGTLVGAILGDPRDAGASSPRSRQ